MNLSCAYLPGLHTASVFLTLTRLLAAQPGPNATYSARAVPNGKSLICSDTESWPPSSMRRIASLYAGVRGD